MANDLPLSGKQRETWVRKPVLLYCTAELFFFENNILCSNVTLIFTFMPYMRILLTSSSLILQK